MLTGRFLLGTGTPGNDNGNRVPVHEYLPLQLYSVQEMWIQFVQGIGRTYWVLAWYLDTTGTIVADAS